MLEISGERVILDSELAALYGIRTKPLSQAVRFPDDFRVHLAEAEVAARDR
jgi:hypothetical protein